MEVREESVPLSGGARAFELVVERAEGCGGVVGLETVPVVYGLEGDAGHVGGVLWVHGGGGRRQSSVCRRPRGRARRGT